GSVGTRCLVMLLQDNYDQPLFLQLKEARRSVLEAFKVVGVGSVGTRCLVMLLQDNYDQPLFLQLKEARRSVLE
uniref:DUF2252 family protein n=1 Tax=Aquitalea pelogenes TaxID=1293573 RepID=UPI000AA904D1